MRERSKTLALAVATLLLLGAVGCGGDDDEQSPAAPSAETSPGAGDAGSKPSSGGKEPSSEGEGGSGGEAEPPVRGGEASIEDFGSEAEGADRAAILGSFETYLRALAGGDHETACERLSTPVQRSLTQLAPKALEAQGCPGILPKLLSPTAPAVAREQAAGEVTRVRVEGDQAFVVFKAPGAELYQLTMVDEGGTWKAATVAASVLVPDL
jgi:hypothetical protein